VLFFVLPKVPEAGTLGQKQATHFLHEVLRAKGYRVNTLAEPLDLHSQPEARNESMRGQTHHELTNSIMNLGASKESGRRADH